ncbi:PocR ligand-binding domain-containing protein [Bacillota bacterium LX-D]|nr:PocR ligand-binding domain-containing protein [Bacillota bacterium LX-D]
MDRKLETPWLGKSVEKTVLEKLLCSFSKLTGLKALLVDSEGNTLVSTEHEVTDCAFCQIIKSDRLGREKCKRSYARAGREATKYGEPYIFRCHAGLIAWAAPILLEEYAGAIICGQVLMWDPEDYFLDEIQEMVKGLNVDLHAVKKAAVTLDVMPSDKVQAASDLLFVVANQIMHRGVEALEQRKKIASHQAILGETIQDKKKLLSVTHKLPVPIKRLEKYSLNNEYELMAKVRNAERKAAEELLDSLLVNIIEKNFGQIDSVKARVMEILVMISRAAVDGGISFDEVERLNCEIYEQLYKKENTEEICFWTKSVLNTLIDNVEKSRGFKSYKVVQKAAEYIRNNFHTKMTLNSVAEAIHLSPCYLSRIFKQTYGCTLMEYLTHIRLENAKLMLRSSDYNIMQIALQNGFEDASYFARVFKKMEGISPSQYKQKAQ